MIYTRIARAEADSAKKAAIEAESSIVASKNISLKLNKFSREKNKTLAITKTIKEIYTELDNIKSMLPEIEKKPRKEKSTEREERKGKRKGERKIEEKEKTKYEQELESLKEKISSLS